MKTEVDQQEIIKYIQDNLVIKVAAYHSCRGINEYPDILVKGLLMESVL